MRWSKHKHALHKHALLAERNKGFKAGGRDARQSSGKAAAKLQPPPENRASACHSNAPREWCRGKGDQRGVLTLHCPPSLAFPPPPPPPPPAAVAAAPPSPPSVDGRLLLLLLLLQRLLQPLLLLLLLLPLLLLLLLLQRLLQSLSVSTARRPRD